jgi:intein/homing endonuclease
MEVSAAYKNPPAEIMSMWPDGSIRPHKVARIVKTGRKPLLKVVTQSGRAVKATPEHRLLTTEGYKRIDEMRIGMELITVPRKVTDSQRQARRENITQLNRSAQQRAQATS